MADIGFDDIRPLFSALPPLDAAAGSGLRGQIASDADGDAVAWIAETRGTVDVALDRPRIALFAGLHHGSAGDFDRNRASIESRIDGLTRASDPLYDLCGAVDVDLRLYEMALDEPAGADPNGPALGEGACARAIAYGLMAVEDGLDIVGISALAPGIAPVLHAVADAAFGEAGLSPDADVILNILAEAGGHETCALFGALLAARIARTPVLLDGSSALAAAALLACAVPGSTGHCRAVAPAQDDLEALFVERAGLVSPVLDGPTEGDGRGAARAILSLRTSLQGGSPAPH